MVTATEKLVIQHRQLQMEGGNQRHTDESMRINPNNVIAPMLSGTDLNNKPRMPFNKALGQQMRAQGEDGEMLLEIFDEIEKYGATPFEHDKPNDLIIQHPQAARYHIAVQAAL